MNQNQSIDPRDWLLLVGLSIMWGASFFFNGVSLRELPPLTIVLWRVALAAAILVFVARLSRISLPANLDQWRPFIVMSILNNVIPFSLLVFGQSLIPSGLSSVANATTPLFTVVIMAAAGEERLLARKLLGVLMGILGVLLLKGSIDVGWQQSVGLLSCLAAAMSYGLSALYARRHLVDAPPLLSAASQLICSTVIMSIVVLVMERPWLKPFPGPATALAIIGSAVFSTALAYVTFFKIIERSGPTNVMLVTLLIPVTALLLGTVFLGESMTALELIGAIVIASALLIIDGRALKLIKRTPRQPNGR